MGGLIGLFLAIFIIQLTVNLYFQSKKSPLQYLIPIGVIVTSFIIIGISFIIEAWEEIELGAIGFTLFISSALSFIITAIIHNMKDLKKSYWD